MTYVNVKLSEDGAKVLTDDVAMNTQDDPSEWFFQDRVQKVHSLGNHVLFWARGTLDPFLSVSKHLKDKFSNVVNLDEHIAEIGKEAANAHDEHCAGVYNRICGLDPEQGIDPEQAPLELERLCENDSLTKCELHFVGYSQEQKGFAVFSVERENNKWSLRWTPKNIMFGAWSPGITELNKHLGREPETLEERKTCLGFDCYDVAHWSWTENLDGPTIQHGKVYQYTVTREGFFEPELVGTFRECVELAKQWREEHGIVHFPEKAKGREDELVEEDETGAGADTSSGANKNQGRKVGRNQPCPCGSGKKYKKCCGQG